MDLNTVFLVSVKGVFINTFDTFEVKDKGTAFTFLLKDNQHLIGMKLLHTIVKISDTPYFVNEIEKFYSESEDEIIYGIIAEKVGSFEE